MKLYNNKTLLQNKTLIQGLKTTSSSNRSYFQITQGQKNMLGFELTNRGKLRLNYSFAIQHFVYMPAKILMLKHRPLSFKTH